MFVAYCENRHGGRSAQFERRTTASVLAHARGLARELGVDVVRVVLNGRERGLREQSNRVYVCTCGASWHDHGFDSAWECLH